MQISVIAGKAKSFSLLDPAEKAEYILTESIKSPVQHMRANCLRLNIVNYSPS